MEKRTPVCVERLGVGVGGGIVPVGVAVGAKVFPSIVGARVGGDAVGVTDGGVVGDAVGGVVGDTVGGTVPQVTLSRSVPAWELS